MEYFEEIPEEERKTYISQFEKMLRSPDIKYYDIHVYEEFTEYFLDHGQIELAVLCVEKGLMLFPYNVELKVLQAECFYLDKNYSKLKTATLDLLAKGKDDESVLAFHGCALINEQDFEHGLNFLHKAIHSINGDEQIDVYHRVIVSLEKNNRLEEAILLLEALLTKVNDKQNYLFLYYQICEISNEIERGRKMISSMIDTDPFNKEAWYLLANLERNEENYSAALEAIEYATAIDDGFIPAIREKAEIQTELGEFSDALEQYKSLRELGEDEEIILAQESSLYQRAGELDKAEGCLFGITQINPNNSEAFFGLGLLSSVKSDIESAIFNFKKAIALNPNYFLYPLQMADLLIEVGEFAKAIPYVKQASDLSKDEPRTLLLRMRVAHTLEDRNEALSIFEAEKDALNHLSSDLIAFICKLYWFEGRKSQSIEYFLDGLQKQSANFQHFLEIYFPESFEITEFCDLIELFDDEL